MGVGGQGHDPYENPRENLENRKTEYLATILASKDDDGPAKRRGYLRRVSDHANPAPARLGQLNKDLKRKTPPYLTDTAPAAYVAAYEYQYLAAEDLNMAVARLVAGGAAPIPRVFPSKERPDPQKQSGDWIEIQDDARRLPSLTEPAGPAMLLAIVQLLHQDLRSFLKDVILLPALTQAAEDDPKQRDADRTAYCNPIIIDLYERWTPQGYPEDQRATLEARIGDFSLPGTEPVSAADSLTAPPDVGGHDMQPPGGSVGQTSQSGAPRGPVSIPPPDYYPRMGPDKARGFAAGFMLLTPRVGEMLIDRASRLTQHNVLTDQMLAAWEWLAFIAEATREPLGEALRRIAGKVVRDARFDSETRGKFWPDGPIDEAFLSAIPKNPFLWSVRTKRPKLTIPADFPYPEFTEEGL